MRKASSIAPPQPVVHVNQLHMYPQAHGPLPRSPLDVIMRASAAGDSISCVESIGDIVPPCADHLDDFPFAPLEDEGLLDLPTLDVDASANGEQGAHSVRVCTYVSCGAGMVLQRCCKGSRRSFSWCRLLPYVTPRPEMGLPPARSLTPCSLSSAGVSGAVLLSASATPDIDVTLPGVNGDPCMAPSSQPVVQSSSWTGTRDWASTPGLVTNRQLVRKPQSMMQWSEAVSATTSFRQQLAGCFLARTIRQSYRSPPTHL